MQNLSYKTLFLIIVILLIPIVFILRLDKSPKVVQAEWYNDSWTYRKAINITAHTAAESNVYIITTINIGVTTNAQPDDGDFRFTDINGQLLNYYIASNAGTTAPTFHVFIPFFPAGNQTFFAYYGNRLVANGFSQTGYATQATNYTIGSYGAEEKTPGPIAYWKFDEGVGTTAYDSSQNNSNNAIFMTGTSAPSWAAATTCVSGPCISFGGNDYLTIATTIPYIKTVSFWLNVSSTAPGIIDFNGTQNINVSLGSVIAKNFTSPTIYINGQVGSTGITANTWYHVAISTGTSFTSTVFRIGKVGTTFPTGSIDDIKIYQYARTQAQIRQDYTSTKAGQSSGEGANINIGGSGNDTLSTSLVGWYKLDEGTSNVVNNSGSRSPSLGGSLAPGTSSPTWTINGKFGHALNFDGTNDYLSIGNTDSIYGVSLWYYATNTAPSFFELNATVNIGASGSTAYAIGVTSPTIYIDGIPTTNIGTTNTWHHFALTTSSQMNGSAFKVGRTGTKYHLGFIDEVKVYTAQLSRNNVITDFNQGSSVTLGNLSSSTGNTAPQLSTSQEFCIPGDTTTCAPPVGWWKFDEGIGTSTFDTSGNNLNLSLGSGVAAQIPAWGTGKIGHGLFFDGDTDELRKIDPGNEIFEPPLGMTIEAWIYPTALTATAGEMVISSKTGVASNPYYSWFLAIADYSPNVDALRFRWANSSSTAFECHSFDTTGTKITANTWQHVAGVRDGATLKVYINGINVSKNCDTPGVGDTIYNSNQEFIIGNNNTSFQGKIDDVRLYDYVRTPAQISWDMNKGKPTAWYRFDECQGSTLNNSSQVGYSGSISIGAGGGLTTLGTCTSGPATAAWTSGAIGKYNGSLSFDGTDDVITIGGTISPVASVSFWVKPTSISNNKFFQLNSTVSIGATSNTVSAPGFTSPTIYVDGIGTSLLNAGTWQLVTVSSGSTIQANAIKLGQATTYFSGQLDDVQIFTYPLNQTQVKIIDNNGSVFFK